MVPQFLLPNDLHSQKGQLQVTINVQPIEDRWAAMIVPDGVLPPGPDEVKGMAFFGATADEVEQMANAYLLAESVN